MAKKFTKKELEKQLREDADNRRKMTPEELAELHREELAEADLLDRMDIDAVAPADAQEYIKAFDDGASHDAGLLDGMDIDPDASADAQEYIKAFDDGAGHDAGFEETLFDSSESAMDESHDDEHELFDTKELEGKEKGGKTRKSKPKSKRRTKRKSVKKSKRMRRRKSKRTRR